MGGHERALGLAIAAAASQLFVLPYYWALGLPPYAYTYFWFTALALLQTVGLILVVAGIAFVALEHKALATACFFFAAVFNLLSLFVPSLLSVYPVVAAVLLLAAGFERDN